ncbi:MAG: hemerythrin family protein [Planctomycetota bacterium]|jgi:hemerythrin|nr:hemerythrin family protein [Planctomycetota bacterium]
MLWNTGLEVGVPQIDSQHKELFRQVDILMDNSKKDRIPETLKFLGNYVVKHFTDEQVLHAASKYPKADLHKGYHTKFISTFNDLKKEFDTSGQSLPTMLKINNTVVNWLKDHIMVHDKEFATYYKNR